MGYLVAGSVVLLTGVAGVLNGEAAMGLFFTVLGAGMAFGGWRRMSSASGARSIWSAQSAQATQMATSVVGEPKEVGATGEVQAQNRIIVRTYRGSQRATAAAFEQDARRLADQGYYPTTQNWAAGSWGCGAFLVALLLCLVLVGILVFIYMLIVKPAGTLTVTYEYRGPVGTP